VDWGWAGGSSADYGNEMAALFPISGPLSICPPFVHNAKQLVHLSCF